MKNFLFVSLLISVQLLAHSGGTDSDDCHSGSQPYHCHKNKLPSQSLGGEKILKGIITHVRDGDTIEVNDTPIRLAALDCPEKDTKEGLYASRVAQQLKGSQAICELTGAKTYNRLVAYCIVNGIDFGSFMMSNSDCEVWKKYDIWNRY
jgi:endonuclease YncB( thermonuclease family)